VILQLTHLLEARPSISKVIIIQAGALPVDRSETLQILHAGLAAGQNPSRRRLQLRRLEFPGGNAPAEAVEAAFGEVFRTLRAEKEAGSSLHLVLDGRESEIASLAALDSLGIAAAQLCFDAEDHLWRITPAGKLIEAALGLRPARRGPVEQNQRRGRSERSERQQLRQLSASLQAARESESRRMAREIHDNLGAALTGLKMDLAWINKHIQDPRPLLQGRLQSMAELIDEMVDAVRRIATELRPAILDEIGLAAALEWQLREFRERTGITCRFECALERTSLDEGQATAAFRIFQEALTNVARHAGASQVQVTLEEDGERFILQVTDNGRGITPAEVRGMASLGLLGMQERALMAGGEVQFRGEPSKGTCVTIRLPLRNGSVHV